MCVVKSALTERGKCDLLVGHHEVDVGSARRKEQVVSEHPNSLEQELEGSSVWIAVLVEFEVPGVFPVVAGDIPVPPVDLSPERQRNVWPDSLSLPSYREHRPPMGPRSERPLPPRSLVDRPKTRNAACFALPAA
ncbi:MAG: hypothetical protein B6A08_06160 [Sorangiineae bacterium NIC37A_2]|nr:MAG: hypothetical protein B6A08_06160 [Sorangiineae bacterium NIC37A_2]